MPRKPTRTTSALVSWTQIANATGYQVMWGTASGQYSYMHDVTAGLNYRVAGLRRGTPYYFSSKSYNTAGASPYGNEVRYVP